MSTEHLSPAEGLHRILILLCVSVPSFMINLDSNIVAVSLSSIAQSLHADFADIEWVISAYTLTFASCVMPAGALADRYGRKRMLLIGLSVFTGASLICGAAGDVLLLNSARALQGVGAAILLSSALATLSHTFRGAHRARAFAFWGSVIGIATSLGPVAGGFITQHFGWQWVFYINIPIGAAMFALTLYAVDESRDPHARKVDVPGSLTFSSSLFLVTLALITGNHEGWASNGIVLEFACSGTLFALFLLVETRQQRPMLDLSFFRRPTYIGANIAGLAYAGGLLTMFTYLPIYFQSGLGLSPQKAGLLMLPIALPLFIVPRIVATWLTHRFSGRALLTVGLAIIGVGLSWLAMQALQFDYASMSAGLLIAGVGAGILNGETAKVSMSVIPPERAGMASGVSGTVRFSGIVVGFAALGAILFSRVSATLAEGLPPGSNIDPVALTRSIAAGDLSAGQEEMFPGIDLHGLALHSFGSGYQAILLVGAAIAFSAALLTWLLVRSSDTAPTPRHASSASAVAPQVE
ncbi:MFS transporter [Pseudomonas sp. NFR16]|uniref:MFS transporter n=1 Tax=Pseudomonas sp. NFR16 TaxID=1566248 RepID=UPI0008BDCC0B|nr:MFS transporter [Pseudomonas sp. NFR16]SEJ97295.1 drug resistance transporter, EmrB/QacA subfamily [Pseudomonas sp. NFR16]